MFPCKRKTSARILILLLLTTLATAACSPQPLATPTLPVLTTAPSADWIQVYFTDPAHPDAKNYTGGPDEGPGRRHPLGAPIRGHGVYSLNLWSIRDALLDAHHHGVNVRIVMESDNMDSDEVQELIAAGIPLWATAAKA